MKNILVIEDDKAVLENISELLEHENFNVYRAENGLIGVERAKEFLPDLIISDITMPGLDGYGVIKALSEINETANIPFIFLSARADKFDRRMGMELGADDFLSKPVTPQELFAAISARLKKKDKVNFASDEKIKQFSLSIASSIPHELRTPLNGILASAQLLNDYYDKLNEQETKEINGTLLTSAKRLESLIYKYLIFVETELILLNPEKLASTWMIITNSPADMIIETIKNLGIKNCRVKELIYNIVDADLYIYKNHLQYIVEELVANAIKFSKSDTPIDIQTWQENDKYYIQVIDNGIGMSNCEIEQIGEMKQFGRKQMEQQGMGLGLAIVQRLVKIYQGEMNVESKKGSFTRITIILPCFKKSTIDCSDE